MEIRRLSLKRSENRQLVTEFLTDAGLRLDEGIGYFAGVFDQEEDLIGCGGVDGNIIKCLAVTPETRGTGASAKLISHLLDVIFNSGHTNARVFTKPEYRDLFKSLGFSVCGEGHSAVLLESDSMELKRYCRYLNAHRADGVIIANADPVTQGHLYLMTVAASHCRKLAVIAVGPNPRNTFRYNDRISMLRKATAHLGNVEILEGSEYAVSEISFPSYFLKKADEISLSQAEIDLDIFRRHIAPALGCATRFVGTEPTDALTAQYNFLMKKLLPENGIAVVETERLTDADTPVSASTVRRILRKGGIKDALELVPASDIPYFLAYSALDSLRKELALAPKPGLVDPYDSGSHRDMDFALMSRSIDSLHGYFVDLAVTAFESEAISTDELRRLGTEAEEQMMKSTGGVNTHRGAIFSMGLAVAAAARILSGKSGRSLSGEIAALAKGFSTPSSGTHGQKVRQQFGITGALENAQSGYSLLFREWLPFYRSTTKSDNDCLRLLMKIISEIDDSNAIYRAGLQKANEARRKAARLTGKDCTPLILRELNEDFRNDNISHGGAADMLALTFFADSVADAVNTLDQ